MASLADIRARHRAEERDAILGALLHNDWRLHSAAEALGIAPSSLQTLIRRHRLGDAYRAHNPGRGRPRKTTTE